MKLVQESSVNMMEKLVKIEDSTSKCDSEHCRTKYKVVTNTVKQFLFQCYLDDSDILGGNNRTNERAI